MKLEQLLEKTNCHLKAKELLLEDLKNKYGAEVSFTLYHDLYETMHCAGLEKSYKSEVSNPDYCKNMIGKYH